MANIEIKYNPYKLETVLKIDGKTPVGNTEVEAPQRDERLQEWIDRLPRYLNGISGTKTHLIKFIGTQLDFEDMEEVLCGSKVRDEGYTFQLNSEIVSVDENQEEKIVEIFDKLRNGPVDELKDRKIINAFNQAKDTSFEIDVVATMSAGKSTLINALLGQKILPSKQEACTAIITKIRDNDSSIFSYFAYDNNYKELSKGQNIDLNTMNDLNNDDNVFEVELNGDIPFVNSNENALVLVDTPGPNNSRDAHHEIIQREMLSKSSKALIIYITTGQFGTTDEDILLKYIAESTKTGGKQSRDRFIFIINKLDQCNSDEDDIQSTIDKVTGILYDKGIENPHIFPVAALSNLTIKQFLRGDYEGDDTKIRKVSSEIEKFIKEDFYHFEKHTPLNEKLRTQIENKLIEVANNRENTALIHTGLYAVELYIKQYLVRYAKTAKIKNIVDTFISKVQDQENTLGGIIADLEKSEDERKEILENIGRLDIILKSGDEAKKYRNSQSSFITQSIEKCRNEIDSQYKAIMTSIRGIFEDYAKNDKISPNDAESIVKKLEKEVNILQSQLEKSANKILIENIKKASEKFLNEYTDILVKILDDLEILNGFSVESLRFNESKISLSTNGINSIISIDVSEHRCEKEGFFNGVLRLFSFGLLGTETRLEHHEYISKEALSNKYLSPIESQFSTDTNSIKEKLESADVQFSKMLDEIISLVDSKLKYAAKDRKTQLSAKENVETRIKDFETKKEFLENIEKEIENLIEI